MNEPCGPCAKKNRKGPDPWKLADAAFRVWAKRKSRTVGRRTPYVYGYVEGFEAGRKSR